MRFRIPGLLAVASAAAVVCACGGGTNLTTAPTGCVAALSPAAQNAPAAGGTFAVAITVAQSCEWTAVASESWVTLMRASGSGSGSAAYTIAPNTTGDGRSARIRIGDESIAVVQSPADCNYTVNPTLAPVQAIGGTIEFRLDTNVGCAWSASTSDAWISLPVATGDGSRTLSAAIAANTTGSPRVGSIEVAGQTVTVSQDGSSASAPCNVTVSGRTFNVSPDGGTVEIDVTVGPGCSWRTQGLPDWIQTNLESASSSARPVFTVAANASPSARSATFRVGDQAVTIAQAGAGCTYSVNPASQSVLREGATFQIAVTAAAGCNWSASSTDAWLSVRTGSGTGNGTVTVAAAPNTNATPRSGSVQVADKTVRIDQQAGECHYSLGANAGDAGVDGGSLQFSVVASSGCGWKAEQDQGWIAITSASGTGNGTVRLTVSPNPTASERRGTVRVEGLTFAVTQARCTYKGTWESVATKASGPIEKPMLASPSGDTLVVSVDTGVACAWQHSSAPDWIAGVGAGDQRGDGGLKLPVTCNASKAERSGTMKIAGSNATIVQAFDPKVSCGR